MTNTQLPILPSETYSLAPHLPELAEEIVAAIAAEVPEYARPLARGSTAVRRGVHGALAEFVELARGNPVDRGAIAADLGRREVRAGRSLDALLSAYRTGARVAWRRLAALGLEAGLAPETLVLLAEAIFAYVDELSAESAEGFAREQAERAGELERRRRALAELLVATPAPEAGALAAAAEGAHWRLPAKLVVAAWREGEPGAWAPLARATPPIGAPPPDGETAPDGTARPDGSERPDGETAPYGTARPDGTERPDGEAPPDGTARPDGTKRPDGETAPDGTARPDGTKRPDGDAPPYGTARPDGTERPDGAARPTDAGLAAPFGPPAAGSRPVLPADAIRGAAGGLSFAVLAAPAAEFRRALDGHAAGIGPAVAPADAARSFRLAGAALALADDGPVAVDEHRVALLCRAEPELVRELAAERLAPLAGETPGSRARLEATLLAWLRHAGTVAAAAQELGVHPQTVRYRLNRLRELFGAALDDPDARFELELVLRA